MPPCWLLCCKLRRCGSGRSFYDSQSDILPAGVGLIWALTKQKVSSRANFVVRAKMTFTKIPKWTHCDFDAASLFFLLPIRGLKLFNLPAVHSSSFKYLNRAGSPGFLLADASSEMRCHYNCNAIGAEDCFSGWVRTSPVARILHPQANLFRGDAEKQTQWGVQSGRQKGVN